MWNIIFISVIVILAVICLYQKFSVRGRINKAVEKEKGRSVGEIKDLSSEIQRLTFLYSDLKNSQSTVSNTDDAETSAISMPNAEEIVMTKKKLEAEKEEMSIRNKKLWDMSIQIQKEKQRIQLLKSEIELKHKNVTDSIVYAKRIQDAVLPRTDILGESLSDYFLFWRPKETVSGDFYWMKREGNMLIFTVADCTGHGVPGAFMSMMGVAFLNEICARIDEHIKPSDILEQLRSLVIKTLKQDNSNMLEPKDGMDIALCVLNLKTKVLKFSGANNPLYLVRGTELKEFKAVKNPIGLYPRLRDFETVEIQTMPGDYLYMFSDGFADQFGGNSGKKITYGRFKNLLVDINKTTPLASEQQEMLCKFIDDWRAGFVQMDDVLVGGFRI